MRELRYYGFHYCFYFTMNVSDRNPNQSESHTIIKYVVFQTKNHISWQEVSQILNDYSNHFHSSVKSLGLFFCSGGCSCCSNASNWSLNRLFMVSIVLRNSSSCALLSTCAFSVPLVDFKPSKATKIRTKAITFCRDVIFFAQPVDNATIFHWQ